jgi:hypothetical protein
VSWSPPLPPHDRNYPMNCWWVAALCGEVGEDLLSRWLCDTPVLLCRKLDGSVAAIEDRCPHRSAPLPPVFAAPLGLEPGTLYNRENYGSFVSPALQIAAVDLIDPQTKQISGQFRVAHAATPIDRNHMHYFWAGGRDYGTSDSEMAGFRQLTEIGFGEDKVIIEAIQKLQDRDPRPTAQIEKSIKSDGPGVEARRIFGRWMARET